MGKQITKKKVYALAYNEDKSVYKTVIEMPFFIQPKVFYFFILRLLAI